MRMENIRARASSQVQPVKDVVQKTSLAGASFSGENHKALAGFDAEEELGQSGFMGARAAVETRIGGDMEGVFTHAKEVEEMVVRYVLGQTTPMGGGPNDGIV